MKSRAFIYIILAGMLWGTSGIFVHYLAPIGLSSFQMASIRGFVSAVSMIIFALAKDKSIFRANAKQLLLYALGGVAMYLTGSLYFAAMQASSVSTAVVLMYTAPVFVMIYSVAFLGEKLNLLKTLSVVLMIVGCGFVSGIIGGLRFSCEGIILGLGSGLAYSAYNILTKIQMKNRCNPLTASMYCFIFMTVLSFAVTNPLGIVSVAKANISHIPLMIGCGLCTCIFPYFLYTLALRVLPAGTASSLAIVEPMSATVYSIAFLGERLGIFSASGIVLIIGSVFMLSKSERI